VFIFTSLDKSHNVSNASKLPLSAASCHAVFPSTSVARNKFFFTSFELICVSSAQTHIFFSVSAWFVSAAKWKAVYPPSDLASNNSSVFISTSLEQIHNVSNVSIEPSTAARCHAIRPLLTLASNNFFFNSFGLICVSSTQTHILFSVSTRL